MRRVAVAALLLIAACRSCDSVSWPVRGSAGSMRGRHAFPPNAVCGQTNGQPVAFGVVITDTARPFGPSTTATLILVVVPPDGVVRNGSYPLQSLGLGASQGTRAFGVFQADAGEPFEPYPTSGGEIGLDVEHSIVTEAAFSLRFEDGSSLVGQVTPRSCSEEETTVQIE